MYLATVLLLSFGCVALVNVLIAIGQEYAIGIF